MLSLSNVFSSSVDDTIFIDTAEVNLKISGSPWRSSCDSFTYLDAEITGLYQSSSILYRARANPRFNTETNIIDIRIVGKEDLENAQTGSGGLFGSNLPGEHSYRGTLNHYDSKVNGRLNQYKSSNFLTKILELEKVE